MLVYIDETINVAADVLNVFSHFISIYADPEGVKIMSSLFALLGSACLKAARKYVGEIDPR